MIVLKPRIKALFDSGIKQLAKDGVDPTADEVVWLYVLAEKVIKPDVGSGVSFFDAPIRVGSVLLFPLSIQASIWIDRYAKDWWKTDPRKDLLAVTFAMVHSKSKDIFQQMTERRSAWRKIRRWAFWNLSVSYKQLRDVMIDILGDNDYVAIGEQKKEIEAPEWGEVISMLCGAYHLPPETFLYEYSVSTVLQMLKNMPNATGERPSNESVKSIVEWQKVVRFISQLHRPNMGPAVIKDE